MTQKEKNILTNRVSARERRRRKRDRVTDERGKRE